MITFVARVRVTGPNIREHHFARKRRVDMERNATKWGAKLQCGVDWRRKLGPPPYTVTLTRIGKGLLDDDNVVGACKTIRDQVAEELGFDDSPRAPITWRYAQEVGDSYGVRVQIESAQDKVA